VSEVKLASKLDLGMFPLFYESLCFWFKICVCYGGFVHFGSRGVRDKCSATNQIDGE